MDDVSRQLQLNEEQYHQQMVQLETVSMMSKYQLVFTKMDSSLNRINGVLKMRNHNEKMRAFLRMKKYAILMQKKPILEALTIYKLFQNKLTNLFQICSEKVKYKEYKAFSKILLLSKSKHSILKLKEESDRQKREFLQKLNQKDDEIEKQKKKNEELETVLWQQKQRENDQLNKIQQKQKLIQRYENDLFEMKKQPQSTKNSSQDNKVKDIGQIKLKDLENNNALLNIQVQQNQSQINNFVKEMNELLDSHSFIRSKI